MANVVITFISYDDGGGTGLVTLYPMASVSVDDIKYTSCASNHINLSFDASINYMEASIDSKNIYKYTPGDKFNNTVCTASEMYNKWIDALTKA